jgi:hypothetical protein
VEINAGKSLPTSEGDHYQIEVLGTRDTEKLLNEKCKSKR